MNAVAMIALIAGFSVFAIAPAWMPSLKLFIVLALAFYGASGAALFLLLPENAEGTEFMGLAVLLCLFYLLFFASCAVRLARLGASLYAKKKASRQSAG
jgi:hypothetical protein